MRRPGRPLDERGIIGPTDTGVREHLLLLLAHKAFDASKRNRRFLTYVVDEALAGRGDRIKAYNIALAAFDRASDFDPLTDPIVRIEAGRLRRSLELYYLTAGRADRIRIDVPKGSYVPTFTYSKDLDSPPQLAKPQITDAQVAHTSPATPVSCQSAICPNPGVTGGCWQHWSFWL